MTLSRPNKSNAINLIQVQVHHKYINVTFFIVSN
jgi:hypothetical protein